MNTHEHQPLLPPPNHAYSFLPRFGSDATGSAKQRSPMSSNQPSHEGLGRHELMGTVVQHFPPRLFGSHYLLLSSNIERNLEDLIDFAIILSILDVNSLINNIFAAGVCSVPYRLHCLCTRLLSSRRVIQKVGRSCVYCVKLAVCFALLSLLSFGER
jgi:hypothetical protein